MKLFKSLLSSFISFSLVLSQINLTLADTRENIAPLFEPFIKPSLSKQASFPPLELGGNCGPKVLQAILEGMGRKTSLDPLILQTSTQRGQTSLAGLR
ncbi:MAG: hypothetical protein HYS07_03670, partial [Chlamydiae bacterium]|nr:hypothetical protein [Chlamydiota bacterium]MBI3276448.1 hypothetical protein [Chlamydiota bacterium]